MVIVVGTAAVLGFSAFLKRRTKSLKHNNQSQFSEPPPYHNLFAPTDEENRALEREENSQIRAKEREDLRRLAAEKIEKAENFRRDWRTSPDKRKTIELLRLASESENADVFSAVAEDIIKIWRENRIENLTADNLADLLDSHLKTLPQQERTAGALFWLKREIMSLRAADQSKI